MSPLSHRFRTVSLWLSAVAVAVVCLLAPGPAGAATTTTTATAFSQNWSGYAAHRGGVRFRQIRASWRQPSGRCTAGANTYSAFWVGLGGYRLNSDALEQIGSELDCSAGGVASMAAWYELVPGPSRAIRLKLRAGDLIRASVTVRGRRVTLSLSDLTRHKSFVKTITDHEIDVSSADWIAEAPSECSGSGNCRTLPLADFGDVDFSGAVAETTSGRTGSVSSSLWDTTKIVLGSTGRQFVSDSSVATATPSALTRGGRAFSVQYTGTATSTTSSGSPAPAYRSAAMLGSVAGRHGAIERVGARTG